MATPGNIQARPTSRRNVVIVGRTGCGKSSVANSILSDTCVKFPVSSSLNSVTNSVSHTDTTFEQSGKYYNVSVFDTIGLFDTGRLSDQTVMDKVQNYAYRFAPSGVNLVLFIMRKARFSPEEEKAFNYISDRLGRQIRAVSALIITHSEGEKDEERVSTVQNFRRNEKTRSMAECMGKGIYCVGFPDLSTMIPKLAFAMEDGIQEDRQMLRRLIAGCSEAKLTNELKSRSWCSVL